MTRKDFELIARTIKLLPDGPARRETARLFADALTNTNPRFNRLRFLHACGLTSPV